jgi:hypothetical protein
MLIYDLVRITVNTALAIRHHLTITNWWCRDFGFAPHEAACSGWLALVNPSPSRGAA